MQILKYVGFTLIDFHFISHNYEGQFVTNYMHTTHILQCQHFEMVFLMVVFTLLLVDAELN